MSKGGVVVSGSVNVGGDIVGGNKFGNSGFKQACDLARRFIKEKIDQKENPWPAEELLNFEENLVQGKASMIYFRNKLVLKYSDADFVVRSINLVIDYM